MLPVVGCWPELQGGQTCQQCSKVLKYSQTCIRELACHLATTNTAQCSCRRQAALKAILYHCCIIFCTSLDSDSQYSLPISLDKQLSCLTHSRIRQGSPTTNYEPQRALVRPWVLVTCRATKFIKFQGNLHLRKCVQTPSRAIHGRARPMRRSRPAGRRRISRISLTSIGPGSGVTG